MDHIDTADAVVFAYDHTQGVLRVLTILRRWEPFAGRRALPGGHIDPGENPRAAASRELAEETNVSVSARRWARVGVYDEPGRDPRGTYRTHAFSVFLPTMPTPVAADDAADAEWTPLPLIRAAVDSMAFDHRAIVLDAARRPGFMLRVGVHVLAGMFRRHR